MIRTRCLTAVLLTFVSRALPAAELHWVATWETSPGGPAANLRSYNNQTLREIIHTTVSGNSVRVRLSNVYGTKPLAIGAAHVALRRTGSSVASDRALTFGGQPAVSIPTGALVVSDAVKLDAPAQSDLAISIFLPADTPAETVHRAAFQTSYIAAGDVTAAAELPSTTETMTSWPFLVGVDVARPAKTDAIVAFGDSITDGSGSTRDANHRWPDALVDRLYATKRRDSIAVLNAGIGGNRVLHNGAGPLTYSGPSLLTRFNHDVLAEPGVKYVILMEGINDIGVPGTTVAPASDEVTPADIIAGLRQIVERAHEQDLRVFIGTLTPFEVSTIPGYYTPERETRRQEVNKWIRAGQGFDGVIDFDKAVADPEHPARILPRYDSGDHLHLSDAGYQAMAGAIDLSLFRVK